MFLSNDLRMLVKGFTIIVFLIGIFFPVITVEVEVESTDNLLESFDSEYMVLYSNKIEQGSIDGSNDQVIYNQMETNNVLSFIMLFLLIIGVAILSGSIFANFMEEEPKFFGEWYSTVVGYIAFLLLFGIILLKITLLESDLSSVNGKSLFENIETSRGDVSFYMSPKKSIFYTLMQISLLSYIILPITNKLLVEKQYKHS